MLKIGHSPLFLIVCGKVYPYCPPSAPHTKSSKRVCVWHITRDRDLENLFHCRKLVSLMFIAGCWWLSLGLVPNWICSLNSSFYVATLFVQLLTRTNNSRQRYSPMCSHSDDNSYLPWIILKVKRQTRTQTHWSKDLRLMPKMQDLPNFSNLANIASGLSTLVLFPSCPLSWWIHVLKQSQEKKKGESESESLSPALHLHCINPHSSHLSKEKLAS